MIGRIRFAALTVSALLVSSCSPDPYGNLDAPQKFFKKNRVGTSPDYAIVKFGDIKDHVVTVHGFSDDLASCFKIVKSMNADACSEITDGSQCLDPYSCRILNQ